jgi:hypothetical protein
VVNGIIGDGSMEESTIIEIIKQNGILEYQNERLREENKDLKRNQGIKYLDMREQYAYETAINLLVDQIVEMHSYYCMTDISYNATMDLIREKLQKIKESE